MLPIKLIDKMVSPFDPIDLDSTEERHTSVFFHAHRVLKLHSIIRMVTAVTAVTSWSGRSRKQKKTLNLFRRLVIGVTA